MDIPAALPLKCAVELLAESSYGFCLVDVELREEDLALFDKLAVESTQDFNYFGGLEKLVQSLVPFLEAIGPNSKEVIGKAADCVCRIAGQILKASGKEMAWIFLRASVPNHNYDLVHWHVDGYYYAAIPPPELQYKFLLTLVGPPTLFYQVPKGDPVRKELWAYMRYRDYTSKLFSLDEALYLERDVGALILAGDPQIAGIHSEPKMDQDRRLFFSLVPAHADEIEGLKQRAMQ